MRSLSDLFEIAPADIGGEKWNVSTLYSFLQLRKKSEGDVLYDYDL